MMLIVMKEMKNHYSGIYLISIDSLYFKLRISNDLKDYIDLSSLASHSAENATFWSRLAPFMIIEGISSSELSITLITEPCRLWLIRGFNLAGGFFLY